jgi:hypothetical protein
LSYWSLVRYNSILVLEWASIKFGYWLLAEHTTLVSDRIRRQIHVEDSLESTRNLSVVDSAYTNAYLA